MSTRSQLFRAVVVLYLAMMMAFTLLQFDRAIDWPSSCGLVIRLSILTVIVWKIVTRPRVWSLGLGVLLAVGSAALALRLYLVSHHSSLPLFVVSGIVLSRTAFLWLFCVAPIVCAVACFTLYRSLPRPELLSPSAGADRRG